MAIDPTAREAAPQSSSDQAQSSKNVPPKGLLFVMGALCLGAWFWWSWSNPFGVFGWIYDRATLASHAAEPVLPKAVVDTMVPAYLATLDSWVASGGNVNEIRERVFKPCSELILATASAKDQTFFLNDKEGREEYGVRADICTKLTITRLYPQPEFEKPELVKLACRDLVKSHAVYADLCARAKLKP